MMLILELSTLGLLAISIVLSEKNLFLRRDIKAVRTHNKPKNNYSQTYKNQPSRYFMDDSFFMVKYMEHFSSKMKEKELLKKKQQSKYSYKKQNSKSIINWFKN